MMVTDHGKANEELKALASSKGVELPADLDAKHKSVHAKLAKLSGAEFDKEYVAEMLKGHKKAVSDFEKASKSAKDPELKAFAEKTLPTLRHHLERAQALSGHAAEKSKKGA
jgi:putative membrane protein